jgi:sugar lactone lactonase YvrE
MGGRKLALLAVIGAVVVAASATAASGLRITVVAAPGHVDARRPAAIVVRATRAGKPLQHARVAAWIARGRRRRSFATRARAGGRYRARVVFPSAGRWKFGARVGGTSVTLGSVQVRSRPVPLTFVWPTSVSVESKRSVLLVENGANRVLRIDPVTGKTTPVPPSIEKPYAVVHDPSGGFYLAAGKLLRFEAGAVTTVADAGQDIGPIALAPNGDVYFATETQVFRVAGGTGPTTLVAGTGVKGYGGDGGPAKAAELSGPHGLAVTSDGGLLVCDTGNARVRRIDLVTGRIETWAQLGTPHGIGIAADGTVYVGDADSARVVHFMADGRPLGAMGPIFADPYALSTTGDGTLYVVNTGPAGRLYRIAPDGTYSVVSRRG